MQLFLLSQFLVYIHTPTYTDVLHFHIPVFEGDQHRHRILFLSLIGHIFKTNTKAQNQNFLSSANQQNMMNECHQNKQINILCTSENGNISQNRR